MIKLMTVDGEYAKPNPELRAIPVFRDIITRDRGSEGDHDGRKKLKASREFAWIYFMYDPLSPFMALEEEERRPKVGKLVFEDPKYKPDKTLMKAVKRYKEMTTTLQVRMLQSAREASYTIIDYLKKVDLLEVDDKGKPIHKVNDVIKALERMGEVTDSLDKLEDRVKKQQEKESTIRGGLTLNKYNRS
jgi:hypothetical protein